MSARVKSSVAKSPDVSFWDQHGADVRLAEGADDLAALAPLAGTVVVIDVLSFSTCVSVTVAAGSVVLPLPWRDGRAGSAAADAGAVLAGPRSLTEPSLSPLSLRSLPAGTTLALPSPNGARAVLLAARHASVAVGCLRNATATADVVIGLPGPIVLAAAGERWPDDRLRPALEDRLGAGLVARLLRERGLSLSAEARAAADLATPTELAAAVRDCASGRELAGRGFAADVDSATEVDADARAAVLLDGLLVGR
jgi:2-phosphosulfolactate phosphatase